MSFVSAETSNPMVFLLWSFNMINQGQTKFCSWDKSYLIICILNTYWIQLANTLFGIFASIGICKMKPLIFFWCPLGGFGIYWGKCFWIMKCMHLKQHHLLNIYVSSHKSLILLHCFFLYIQVYLTLILSVSCSFQKIVFFSIHTPLNLTLKLVFLTKVLLWNITPFKDGKVCYHHEK